MRSTFDGQNCVPKQLFEQEPMLEQAPHRKSYFTSARPPSNAGRDHVTMTTLSVTTVTLIFLGSEGGASKGKKTIWY